jgi:hypothetical protein
MRILRYVCASFDADGMEGVHAICCFSVISPMRYQFGVQAPS